LAYLEDLNEQTVWTNVSEPLEAVDGSAGHALHIAIRTAIDHLPDNCTALLFSPQEQITAIYRVSREKRRQDKYRGSNKKLRPSADLIMDNDNVMEARGIALVVRPPEEHHEYDMVNVTLRVEAQDRWQRACRAAESKFGV
jgi:hypothetical protein